MALYFHMFISVVLALAAVVQETRGYTTSNPTNGSATIRLISGTITDSFYDDDPRGLIEVKVGDDWGPLCGVRGGDQFEFSEASVVCRQLGYSYDRLYTHAQDTLDIDTQYEEAFYLDLSCRGYEDSITECHYGVLRGSADACVSSYYGTRGYAGVVCKDNFTASEVSFNYFGWLVLIAIFFTIFMVIRRYRQRGGLCNKRDQMTQHTTVHTTNNMQGVVIPPPSGGSYPPPPPSTYLSQPQANYQYQPPAANAPLVPQYGTGLPPKEGAPPYPAQNTGNPYPQGAPYPKGGAQYPPQGAGAPYPPQGGAPYPPQPAGGAPYPPQGGAPYPPQPTGGVPYPPQNAGAPYQSQYQGVSAPPPGGAPTSDASAPAFNPAFPPADYVPDANTDYTLSTTGWRPTAD